MENRPNEKGWGMQRGLERVKKNQGRFLVSKKGKATAVILDVEYYLKNIVKQPI